jgi:hypothetical protein
VKKTTSSAKKPKPPESPDKSPSRATHWCTRLESCDTVHRQFEIKRKIGAIQQIKGRDRTAIARFEQYSHLVALDKAARKDPELAAALGNDYTITPDVVIVRGLEPDSQINAPEILVDDGVSRLAALRAVNGGLPILHASISCKWTIRSDRVQNARSEALNLIRNRKGKLPHVAVVTGEPLPSRLSAIALGTGDIDCVYQKCPSAAFRKS